MTIEPADAVVGGAQWRVDGGAWQNSGVTVSGLAVGFHLVEFKEIPPEQSSGCFGSQTRSWLTPANQNIHIAAGETTTITGTYVLSANGCTAAGAPGGGSRGDMIVLASVVGGLLVSRARLRGPRRLRR